MNFRQSFVYTQARSGFYDIKRRLIPPLQKWRNNERESGMLPDFLIVGAMKSGTTSLYAYLCQHPGIVEASTKEVEYFSIPEKYARGEQWYRSHFPSQQDLGVLGDNLGYPVVTGEATPAMHLHRYAKDASALLPKARIIMILRDPVARAFSHYINMRRNGVVLQTSFETALQFEKEHLALEIARNKAQPYRITSLFKSHSFVYRGQYLDQIRQWLNYYDRDQILILNSEAMFAAPQRACDRVVSFLGVPSFELSDISVKNEGSYVESMDSDSRSYLVEYFRPHNKRLFEFLGEDWGWPS